MGRFGNSAGFVGVGINPAGLTGGVFNPYPMPPMRWNSLIYGVLGGCFFCGFVKNAVFGEIRDVPSQ